MLSWNYVELADQELSGQGQPIWATPLPSKWVFYSVKQGVGSDFIPTLYTLHIVIDIPTPNKVIPTAARILRALGP